MVNPLSGFGPHGPYMMYLAWKVCTPLGELAEKLDMAEVGTTGPAEVLTEGMSGWLTGSIGKNVDANGMAARLGQMRIKPFISTPFVPQWSIGKSVAENGVPSCQLDGAGWYPKPLTEEKKLAAAEELVKPTSKFGNRQIAPFSTQRLGTAGVGGDKGTDRGLYSERAVVRPAVGACTDRLTTAFHVDRSRNGLAGCPPVAIAIWPPIPAHADFGA